MTIFSKKILLYFFVLFCTFLYLWSIAPAHADEFDELQKQIDELAHLRQLSEAATAPLEATLADLESKIASAQAGIDTAIAENLRLARELEIRQTELAVQYQLLANRVRSFYKRSRFFSPFLIFIESKTAGQLTRDLSYRQATTNQDKRIITQITSEAIDIENTQKTLSARKSQLENLQARLDQEATFFRQEIKGAKDYQADLTKQIAQLSARQQAILAEKAGTFQTTVGDVPLADDPASRPDYNPGFSPAFAAFSFGAPHYKGMSQYGAFGRAKEGQSAEEILKAYYGDVRLETVDTNLTIPTDQGTFSFEDQYLRGIAEMPAKWGDEGGYQALRAQAIAARSYALAYTGWRMGDRSIKNSICTSENCQVYRAGKALNPGRWGDAVNDTRGVILVSHSSSEVVNAWYASTSGGYQESYSSLGHTTPGFWDTKSGRDGWTSEAYEKIASSPWFYKGWYRSRSGDSCGRSHPWLTEEEMADILNAWIVLQQAGDDRVSPQGSCWSGNPYSISELRDKANNSGGAFTSISSVSVEYSNNGITANVFFGTNKGDITISGSEFKTIFNLRAPGRIALKSGLFNIEKK